MSYPQFNLYDLHSKADLSGLPRERLRSETELRRLFKDGILKKDRIGYYTHEKYKNVFGETEIGKKFYIEDAYRHMERLIHNLYEAAYETRAKIFSLFPSTDISDLVKFHALHTEMMVLDFKLLLLFDLYRGYVTDDFLSPEQIDEWLQDQMDLGNMYEAMVNLEESPLGVLARFADSMQCRLKYMDSADYISGEPVLARAISGRGGGASCYEEVSSFPRPPQRPQLTVIKSGNTP